MVLTAAPQDARGFVEHTLVKVPYGERAVFFRVLAVDVARNAVAVRLERFTLFWQHEDIVIGPGVMPPARLKLWRAVGGAGHRVPYLQHAF